MQALTLFLSVWAFGGSACIPPSSPLNDYLLSRQGRSPSASGGIFGFLTAGGDLTTTEDTNLAVEIPQVEDAVGYEIELLPSLGTLLNCLSFPGSDGSDDLTCTYIPFSEVNGSDIFSVLATGQAGATASHAIQIEINPVNDAPSIVIASSTSALSGEIRSLAFSADEGGGVDEDLQSLGFTVVSSNETVLPASAVQIHFSEAVGADAGLVGGMLTFQSSAGQSGTATLTLAVDDGNGGISNHYITVTILPRTVSFEFPSSSINGTEDTAMALTLPSATASDFSVISYQIMTAPSNGTLTNCLGFSGSTGASDLSCTYTPASEFNGSDTLVFRASIPSGATADHTINLSIAAVNDNPTITVASSVSAHSRQSRTLTFSGDEGGGVGENSQTLVWSVTSSNESLISNSDLSISYSESAGVDAAGIQGVLTYRSLQGVYGNATLTLTASDGSGGSSSSAITVVVDSVTFRNDMTTSGYAQLDPQLDFNGTLVDPFLEYNLQDATATSLPARRGGVNLSLAGTGADPVRGLSTPTTAGDLAVRFEGGKYYQAESSAASSTGFSATEDMAIELVYKSTDSGNSFIAGQFDATSNRGWRLYEQRSLGSIYFQMNKNAGTACSVRYIQNDSAWQHVMIFVDRDQASAQGSNIYINGVPDTFPANCSAVDLVTPAATGLTIGSRGDETTPSRSDISFMRIWKRVGGWPGGASNATVWSTIARTRALRYMGVLPQHAVGMSLPSNYNSEAGLLDLVDPLTGIRKLQRVGANWMRVVRRLEKIGGEVMTGYYSENNFSNYALYSQEFDDTLGWTPAAATVTANIIHSPYETRNPVAEAIVPDSTGNEHRLTSVTAFIPNSVQSWLTVWAKAGSQSGVKLSSTQDANAWACFDLSVNGALGSKGSSATSTLIENWGGGWHRVMMKAVAPPFGSQMVVQSVDSSCASFVGDGATPSLYLWGAQMERVNASPHPGSLRITTESSDSRSADILQFATAGGNLQHTSRGQISADILNSAYITGTFYPVSLYEAASYSTKYYRLATTGTRLFMQASGMEASVTTALPYDGEIHSLAGQWGDGNSKAFYDGVVSTDGPVFNDETTIDTLNIGSNGTAPHYNSLIRNVRIRIEPE